MKLTQFPHHSITGPFLDLDPNQRGWWPTMRRPSINSRYNPHLYPFPSWLGDRHNLSNAAGSLQCQPEQSRVEQSIKRLDARLPPRPLQPCAPSENSKFQFHFSSHTHTHRDLLCFGPFTNSPDTATQPLFTLLSREHYDQGCWVICLLCGCSGKGLLVLDPAPFGIKSGVMIGVPWCR